ncbi:hypothetical protein C0989_004999 [Termitomyces sp. Mn162]|nr:hypothetical protein C0989_004999 [Termitomyces sp. Mn162]
MNLARSFSYAFLVLLSLIAASSSAPVGSAQPESNPAGSNPMKILRQNRTPGIAGKVSLTSFDQTCRQGGRDTWSHKVIMLDKDHFVFFTKHNRLPGMLTDQIGLGQLVRRMEFKSPELTNMCLQRCRLTASTGGAPTLYVLDLTPDGKQVHMSATPNELAIINSLVSDSTCYKLLVTRT